jgi:glutathione S-transferase
MKAMARNPWSASAAAAAGTNQWRQDKMKLYDGGRAPNPRRTRIFLAEKGIKLPLEQVDLGALQQKSEPFAAVNPLMRVPALVLDDGTVITESIAICRYFEALHPEPPLFGRGALESAQVEMWNRRMELHFLFPVSHVFRNSHPAMKEMEVPQVPAWAEANKPRILEFITWLDRELGGRRFVAGDSFTVADITGLVTVDFMKPAKLSVPDELKNLKRWHAELAARPSAAA